MAIQEITSPPMLDSTGQTMVTKLQSIASAINSNAGAISYDNTISGMTATKVQSAIDEVKGITDNINASLTNLFITKTYTYSYSNLAGYTGLSITESDFQGEAPSGYTPIAVSYFSTGTDTVIARTVRYSGNSWMNIYNTSSSARSSTATICILYAPTEFVTVS